MAIEQVLTGHLSQGSKAKDGKTSDVVRMIKTKIQERRTAKGASGRVDDALVLDVIGAYRKQLQKALTEFVKVGERGAAQAAVLRFEIEFCERYLPKTMDEAGVLAQVKERNTAPGIAGPQTDRRLVGDSMKSPTGHEKRGAA